MSTDRPQGAAPQGQGDDGGGYTVDARGAMGVQVGEGGTQIIYSSKTYCRCGNPVEFQCQLCKAGLCWACDVIEWRKRNGAGLGLPRIVVPARGVGYLKKIDKAAIEWTITDNRIMRVQMVAGTTIWPILYADDILPSLTEALGDLRHICCTCMSAASVAAAEGIISGRICRIPDCGLQSAEICTCCGGSFCSTGSKINNRHSSMSMQWRNFLIGGAGTISWQRPSGLCITCVSEQVGTWEKKIISRLEAYGFVHYDGSGPDFKFRIPVSPPLQQKKLTRRQRYEYGRAQEEARQAEKHCYAEIQALLEQPVAVGRECEHPQWFTAPDTLSFMREGRGDGRLMISRCVGYVYAMVDQR